MEGGQVKSFPKSFPPGSKVKSIHHMRCVLLSGEGN